jgi:hypothetical protein
MGAWLPLVPLTLLLVTTLGGFCVDAVDFVSCFKEELIDRAEENPGIVELVKVVKRRYRSHQIAWVPSQKPALGGEATVTD